MRVFYIYVHMRVYNSSGLNATLTVCKHALACFHIELITVMDKMMSY